VGSNSRTEGSEVSGKQVRSVGSEIANLLIFERFVRLRGWAPCDVRSCPVLSLDRAPRFPQDAQRLGHSNSPKLNSTSRWIYDFH
jgi:hypothetical protein